MTLGQYIENINKRYQLDNATEHTFRGDLQQLLESLVPAISATNEPKRQSCGAPDYILTKKDIPVGYIEAKDIGDKDLEKLKKTGNKEQFDRYKASLNNLIFTDYLAFYLYRDGVFILKIAIAEITDKGIKPLSENFASFENFIKDFCSHIGQTIKSSKKLAEMMAGKARLLSDVIEKALTSDDTNQENSTLKDQMRAFKEILIHDITAKSFADVYAQTIAYGMFAARLHDPTLPTFSRQEAAELIPKSNPFLRKLFGYIAGPDIDDRIKWIVDGLVEIFLACNVEEILKNYGKTTKMEDPIIHFYETFLSEYDPKLRKARGVWYTPHPVVSFQVRAIDEILKTEFGIVQGIADSSKIKTTINIQGKQVEQEVHKVQMLDPATGTGTYLAEVIRFIHKKFEGQQGIWSNYVENHLLPRLIGFELLMASYAMAHLQIDLLLTETGFKPTKEQRLKIYLTNSLEESHPDTGTLFANWLSSEANEANHVKRDAPVMIVMGNPPYSGESANKGDWIMSLMEDYKKEPGGKEKLKERNPKWINDDYVKFLRYGQYFIEKNGSGILAFINPHGFLDNPTFRGMRWNLLKTYDKIYTIDLHGNAKKKETSPDGSTDVNVFDIEQGVSINLFIKTGKKKNNELGKVFHFDLFGKRETKYDFLIDNSLKSVDYKELPNIAPNYFFKDKDFKEQSSFEMGFSVNEIFNLNNVGIVTARDAFTIHHSKQDVENNILEFLRLDDEEARSRFNLGKDVRDWQVNFARKDLENSYPNKGVFTEICYRPFDNKWTFYTGKSKGFHCYPRAEVMQHFTKGENVGLIIGRQGQAVGSMTWNLSFITKSMTDLNLYYRGGGTTYPLYLYPETKAQQTIDQNTERIPNLNAEIVLQIAKKLGLRFVNEKNTSTSLSVTNSSSPNVSLSGVEDFAPIDVLDYIYSVLHSPTYREKYKEFLKIDFPRVPYPKDKATFWQLVKLGGEIREIHLLESETVEKYITQYPIGGDNVVSKPRFIDNGIADNNEAIANKETASSLAVTGKVYINETQYFDNVPQIAWDFYIGGYQPAQKWLKDRKGRTLEFDDILHYQKIIVALTETDRLMKEIDKIEVE
jgi:predicted helicase